MKPKTGFESGSSPTISESGAPIHTGRGLADVKRRIVEAFERIRTPETLATTPAATPTEVEVVGTTTFEYTEHHEHAFHTRTKYLSHVAMKTIQSHRLRHVSRCFSVSVPSESADVLIEQAIRRLNK
jgi:hypothetical protein